MTSRTGLLQSLQLREHQVFLILTIVIGIGAGLCAVLFTLSIEFVTHRLFGISPGAARLFAVPVLVSLVTGACLAWLFPDVRGSGVPQTEAAYHLSDGVIPTHVPIAKFVLGVLCIGSGHSMGREGPSVQIGAGLASVIGRWLKLPPGRVRDLVPVGAAGALAAAFNTPVAAVLFALEEIIGDLNASLIGSTVVASVASVVVERAILGNEPLFRVPTYQLVHPAELAAYAVLGVVGGFVSLLFCKGLLGLRRFFLDMPSPTKAIQPAIGGLIVGTVLIFVPAVMGVGYEYVDQALNGELVLKTLVLLGLVKLGATVVSYSSGNAGGIFAPSLYIGAMVGGATGVLVHRYAPFPTADAGAYALVGMGTLFAGIIRAPMTSVFMIFEITQDYQILVPLMIANMLSFAISKRYQPVPVYHALLRQDNIHLPSVEEPSPGVRTARDLMRPAAALIPRDLPVERAESLLRESHARVGLVVAPDGRLVGRITRDRTSQMVEGGRGGERVDAIVEPDIVHVHPDHPLELVFERLRESGGLLPVVSRADARRLEGVVTVDTPAGGSARLP